jgi:ceramide synthetase
LQQETQVTNVHAATKLPKEEIRRYLWERKRHMINHQKIVKFVEAFWRAIFYTSFSFIGYRALFVPTTAIWFWDNQHHFVNWPFHDLSPAINFYYQIELGCYFHQLLWTEVSRSDAAEMIAHHFITIVLIFASYLSGFFRIGASILFLHDLADIFLETAKVFNYISKPSTHRWMKAWIVDPLFAVFAITFFITRLVIFPRNILYSVFADGYRIFDCDWFGCPTYIGLLFALQFLHVFWFYLIARMVYKLAMGTMQDDERSDNEEELEQEPGVASSASAEGKEKSKKKKKTKSK